MMKPYVIFACLLLAATTTTTTTVADTTYPPPSPSTTIDTSASTAISPPPTAPSSLSPPPSAPTTPSSGQAPNAAPAVTASDDSGFDKEGTDAGGSSGGPQQPPPPPVWAQCLSQAPVEASRSVVSLFQFWCSHYKQIVPCLATGLSTEAARNPLDQFVQLHFDAQQMQTKSNQLCQSFQGISSRLQCTQQNNASLEEWCRARFSQGLQYVYAVQAQKAFNNDINIYRQLACQVTEDTTGCLGAAMTECDSEVKQHVLAFYAFFTNESCVASPNAVYTTPAPPPPRPPPPRDVVITCAQRIAETLPPSDPLAENATQLDQLLFGLRQNCRSFEARYNCYDEELDKITDPNFRDIWLSFTFNSANAIRSQKQFCEGFEGGVVGALNAECYNNTQPRLHQCEEQYGRGVVAIQQQWADNQLDNVGVHKAACTTSMQRAFCLRDAFSLCGETLAESMLASELGTLPDICFTLLPDDDDDNKNDDSDSSDSERPAVPPATIDASRHPRPTAAPTSHGPREPIPSPENPSLSTKDGNKQLEDTKKTTSPGKGPNNSAAAVDSDATHDSSSPAVDPSTFLVILFAASLVLMQG